MDLVNYSVSGSIRELILEFLENWGNLDEIFGGIKFPVTIVSYWIESGNKKYIESRSWDTYEDLKDNLFPLSSIDDPISVRWGSGNSHMMKSFMGGLYEIVLSDNEESNFTPDDYINLRNKWINNEIEFKDVKSAIENIKFDNGIFKVYMGPEVKEFIDDNLDISLLS